MPIYSFISCSNDLTMRLDRISIKVNKYENFGFYSKVMCTSKIHLAKFDDCNYNRVIPPNNVERKNVENQNIENENDTIIISYKY